MDKKNKNKYCKTANNTLLYGAISSVVFLLVYFTIKEGHRIKIENELLEYEVW